MLYFYPKDDTSGCTREACDFNDALPAFGTIDAWLLWKLTGGRGHATDVTNAARTMLFDIRHQRWDHELLAALHVPDSVLPQVRPSSHVYVETVPALFGSAVPIAGVAGDQQSALFGQACFRAGLAKNTYGTGCFVVSNTGDKRVRSGEGLLTTVGYRIGGRPTFAVEGSIFVAGAAVKWLRDMLGLVESAAATEAAAEASGRRGPVPQAPGRD